MDFGGHSSAPNKDWIHLLSFCRPLIQGAGGHGQSCSCEHYKLAVLCGQRFSTFSTWGTPGLAKSL